MCTMPKRAAPDALLRLLRYHGLLSRGSGRDEDEIEVSRHEIEVGRQVWLGKLGKENVFDMSC